jgi:multiple sugar transport system substrate-binding protein
MDYVKRHKTLYHLPSFLFLSIVVVISLTGCQGLPFLSRIQSKNEVTITPAETQVKKTVTVHPTVTPSSQPTSQFKIEPSDLKGLSLTFWHTWDGSDEEAITKLIDDFNKNNEWKIKVEGVYQGGNDEIGEAVYNAINTGGFPEIVMGYPYQAAYWNSARKIILDLEQYRRDPIWGLSPDEENAYFPVFQSQAEAADSLGFPAQRTAQFLIYNKTWAKALGYKTAPQTPAEFRTQACAAHKANLKDDDPDNDKFGGLIISTNYPTSLTWIYAFGGEVLAQNGSGYQFNTSAVKDAFNFLRLLYDDECAWVSDSQPPVGEFSAREGLFISGNLDTLSLLQTAMTNANNQDEWGVIPFPSASKKPVIEVYGPDYYILQSSSAKQMASWLFIKWLAAPENQAKLIASSGKLPMQSTTLQNLDTSNLTQPQWQAVVDLIPDARAEPVLPSWGVVRWAVGDATTQLFQWYFKTDQIPNLAKLLDETAASLLKGNPKTTPTFTPSP